MLGIVERSVSTWVHSVDDGFHGMFDKVIIVTQQGINSLIIYPATFISMNKNLKGRDN